MHLREDQSLQLMKKADVIAITVTIISKKDSLDVLAAIPVHVIQIAQTELDETQK